jgi:hypothetical protein
MTSIDKKIVDGATLAKEVSSYGKWSLGWGVINLIFSGLSSPFGLLLLVLGAASFYFNLAAMFVVYGIVFIWAALSNLFVGGGLASFFTVILALSAVQAFRAYARYRPVEKMLLSDDAAIETADPEVAMIERGKAAKTARILPWAAFLTAIVSLAGFLASFVFTVGWLVVTGGEQAPGLILFAGALSLQFGVLALALGVASILSGYRYKALSAVGILGGIMALAIDLLLLATS